MTSSEALVKAVQTGDLKSVQALIEEDPKLISFVTDSGIPISLLAAYYRQGAVFDWIMSKRPAPSIFEAAAAGLTGRIKHLLMEHPELLNAYAADGFMPLGLAAYFNQYGVAKILVEQGADVNQLADNASKVAPLHAAVAANSLDITRLLLENGAEVDAAQHGGVTALHSAARRGNAVMVELLLAHGAATGLETDDGKTALDFAREYGHDAVVALLK